MQSFIQTLRQLSLGRQVVLGGAVVAVILLMGLTVLNATKPPMALLYSGLDPARSGEILQALDSRNIPYEIKQQSIFVPQNERDRVRFDLAQEGLPKQAVKGYELLDNVNGFSVTSQMFSTSYWRAKEGELTRTILAIPGVDGARVHIGANMGTGFTRSSTVQSASVTLTTSRALSLEQAEAIQYMVALSVSGLRADDVAVIDSNEGIIAGPNSMAARRTGPMANDLSSTMEQKIQRMLEARVGPGNAQVSVTVDVSREAQRTSSVSFDPESRVIRQRTVNDSNTTSSGGVGGALTVASNLPQAAAPEGNASESETRNSTESVSYELNEVRTETERLPGQIQRVTVAVLLNEQALISTVDTGAPTPAPEDMVAEFERLVATAAGLNFERGDGLTVELMPFAAIADEVVVAAPGLVERLIEQHFWTGLQSLLLVLVIGALGFGVVRPILSSSPPREETEPEATPESVDSFGFPVDDTGSDPFAYLKDYADQREEETAAILNEWLTEDRKVAVNE